MKPPPIRIPDDISEQNDFKLPKITKRKVWLVSKSQRFNPVSIRKALYDQLCVELENMKVR